MSPPVLPFGSLGGLKGSSTAGMNHTARRWITGQQTLPNQEVVDVPPRFGPETCCHLALIGSQLAAIAAAQGIKATWSLKLPTGTDAPAGSQWEVTSDQAGRCWTETVEVTGDLMKHGRIFRLVAAKDTQLNRR